MSFQSPATRQCFSSILCVSLRICLSLTPAFGESSPRAVDQKQHLHYKGEGSPRIRTAPPKPQKGAAFFPPLHRSFKSALEKFILLVPPDEFL